MSLANRKLRKGQMCRPKVLWKTLGVGGQFTHSVRRRYNFYGEKQLIAVPTPVYLYRHKYINSYNGWPSVVWTANQFRPPIALRTGRASDAWREKMTANFNPNRDNAWIRTPLSAFLSRSNDYASELFSTVHAMDINPYISKSGSES